MSEHPYNPKLTPPADTPVSSVYPTLIDILDSLPVGVVLLRDDCLIEAVNREGARLLGRRQVDLFEQSFPDIWTTLTSSSTATVMNHLQDVASSQKPTPLLTTHLRHGSTGLIPVQWTCHVIAREGRRDTFGLTVYLRDLSLEEELREDRDRLAAMAEDAPSPIVELNQYGHMLYANPTMTSWIETLGYRADGLPHMLPEDLSQLITQCLQSGEIIHGKEVSLPHASFTWTFCPVKSHRLVRGYAIDMTKVHQAQRELIRTADELKEINQRLDDALSAAQESTRAKSAFLAMMSHEIRTPMNGVIGMTSLLLETALSPEQKTYADTIRQCGDSLLHIINDVLECSKIEAGKLELETVDFDLRTIVEDILTQFAQRAEIKGIELTGLVHATVPAGLRGDPGRLRQVLTNLLGNALKFTEKGEVTIQAYLEQDSSNSATVRFEVTDSGIGIEPEVQAKLFKPFMQADSSTTRKYGGTGLGLMISKQLIELMGGQIGVGSVVGRGSTFWCTARFIKQADSPRAILPSGDLKGRRVLIVDDNESNRIILRHLATGWGMVADMAENAEEALDKINEAPQQHISYDLAILDVVMPGKDGLQLAREIRRHPAGSEIRIVVLTSLLQRGHAEQARQAGALGYLPKPVRHDQLHECLRTVLGISHDTQVTSPQTAQARQRRLKAPSPAQPLSHPRILIVEDNIINQKLVVRMAEKLGYPSAVAENGQDAIEMLTKEQFGLVLMDCQMPVMDGFEATQRIREAEAHHAEADDSTSASTDHDVDLIGWRHIPIIAVTANAMQGDRAHCLAIGMDDYLAKPIHLDALRDILHRWAPPGQKPTDASSSSSTLPNSDHVRFDAVKMFRNIGEDDQLFQQLIALFLNRHRTMLAEIKQRLDKADALAVERAAHTLKGTAGNLCAPAVVLAASRLEAIGHLGTLQDAPPVYAQLETEVLRLAHILDRYRQGYEPTSKAA